MMGPTNKTILSNKLQRTLRRHMTDAEQAMWRILRDRQVHGHKFRRQHPFGDHILDFVCLELMLVIEIDGGHHQEQIDADGIRTHHLENAGFRVERFWNNKVLHDIEAVKDRISIIVQELDPIPTPALPLKGREITEQA